MRLLQARTVDDGLGTRAQRMIIGAAVEADGPDGDAVIFLRTISVLMAGLTAAEARLSSRADADRGSEPRERWYSLLPNQQAAAIA